MDTVRLPLWWMEESIKAASGFRPNRLALAINIALHERWMWHVQ